VISGTFAAMTAQSQPMAAKPAPANRHGQMTQPDDNWSAPAAQTGAGYPDPQPVDPQMTGRGIRYDVGHERGHGATASVRRARSPFVTQDGAQAASAVAHGDPMGGYWNGHQYDAPPQQFAGSRYEVLPQNVRAIPSFKARTIWHSRAGGQFSEGTGGGDVAPTGFPIGEAGRFAVARYSSPALGAMYSRNPLRGVLPQMISTPYNQPGLSGAAGTKASGIPSNARFLAKPFTTPALFRSPASESDGIIAAAPATPDIGPVMGVGF
jgi:hypothetical protein